MDSPLIISERRWFPRAVDVFLTLCGWGIFIWLFCKVFANAFWSDDFSELHSSASGMSVHLYIFLINALILIAWGKWEQYRYHARKEKRTRADALDTSRLAGSFSLSYEATQELNHNKIQRVWHDEHGVITKIDNLSR